MEKDLSIVIVVKYQTENNPLHVLKAWSIEHEKKIAGSRCGVGRDGGSGSGGSNGVNSQKETERASETKKNLSHAINHTQTRIQMQ